MPDPVHAGTARPDVVPPPDRRRPAHQALRADGQRMLTVTEVAHYLNCTPKIVRKLITHGILRSVKYTARTTRIPEASVWTLLHR